MTRQVCYVFFGYNRGEKHAHESPRVMTLPLAILAFFALRSASSARRRGHGSAPSLRIELQRSHRHEFFEPGLGLLMLTSSLVVFAGLGLGWWLYGNKSPKPEEPDALEKSAPWLWAPLRDRLYVDELYGVTVIAFYKWWARVADWLDRRVWGGIVASRRLAHRPLGTIQSLLRQQLGQRRLRQNLRRAFLRRRPALARRRRTRAELSAHSRRGNGRARRNSSLEQLAMNALATGFPILTLLTVLPLAGAAIALFSGRHARIVAIFTSLVCLLLSLYHLDAPARRRQYRPGRARCTGRPRSALSIISASTGSGR